MMNRDVNIFKERRVGPWLLALVLAIGVAVGAGLASWRGAASDEAARAEEQSGEHAQELPAGGVEVPEAAQRNAGLQVLTPEKRMMPATIEVTGVVAADDSKGAHIRPLERGVIESISVSLGARVTGGQALLTYDNIELGGLIGEYLSQRAALLQAQTDLEVRRLALERAQELIKLEAIAQQTVEARRADFKNAEAAVASQRASVAKVEEQIHRFGLTDIDLQALTPEGDRNSHRTASHSVLRAPFTGVVTKYDVAAGELVEPERELFTISDLSVVWVMADVYEKDLAAKVRCVVPNPDAAIKLDMFAKVDVRRTSTISSSRLAPAARLSISRISGKRCSHRKCAKAP